MKYEKNSETPQRLTDFCTHSKYSLTHDDGQKSIGKNSPSIMTAKELVYVPINAIGRTSIHCHVEYDGVFPRMSCESIII